MGESSTPDRFSEDAVIGYRYWYIWRTTAGTMTLVSPVMSVFTWEPMRRAEATCRHHPGVPSVDCSCGIHAWKEADGHVIPVSGRDLLVAVGEVSLWGTVLEHERGYRAQYAYPYALEIHPAPALITGVRNSSAVTRAESAALELTAVYGVETRVRYPREHRRPRREATDRDHSGERAGARAPADSGADSGADPDAGASS